MRFIALGVAAALLMAGCGSADPKEPKPTTAPTATATVPTMPPEAKEDSKAGAIAFVKHYIDVFNYASNTGDVEELQKLSDPKCEGCTKYIDLYKKTYAAGGYFKDSGWKVQSYEIDNHSAHWGLQVTVNAPQSKYRGSTDAESSTEAGGVYQLFFHITADQKVDVFERSEDS